MANELQFYGDPATDSGLTIIARVYDSAGAQVGADVSCTEVGALAIYQGDMPAAAAGEYAVRFFDGTEMKAQGCISWDGSAEITNVMTDALLDVMSADVTAILADTSTDIPNAIAALNNISAADVWAATTRTLTDTSGFTLSPGEYVTIATAVEQAILDEADGQQVLNAIVGAIGNSNVDEIALVAAIRADLERSGGAIDLIETQAEADARQVLLIAEHDSTQAAITSGAGVDPAVIAAAVWDADMTLHTATDSAGSTQPGADSSALASNIAVALNSLGSLDVNVVKVTGTNISNIFDFHVDISGLETKGQADARQADLLEEHSNTQIDIAALNNVSLMDINNSLLTYDSVTQADLDASQATIIAAIPAAVTASDVYTVFTNGSNADAFKADVAGALALYDGVTQADLDAAEATILAGQTSSTLTAADVYTEFTTGANADAFQADLTGVATQADIAASEANVLAGQAGITATVDYDLVADAVWDEDMAAHTAANSAGATQPYQDNVTLANALQAQINANGGVLADVVRVTGLNVSGIFDFHTDISGLETKGQADARQAVLVGKHSDTQVAISNLDDISLADVTTAIGNYDAATGAELSTVEANIIAAIPGTGFSPADVYNYFTQGTNEDAFKTDISSLATQASLSSTANILSVQNAAIQATLAAQNDLSAADVDSILGTYDAATPADIAASETNIIASIGSSVIDPADVYAEFTTGANADAFKTDLTGIATQTDVTASETNVLAGQVAQQAANAALLSNIPQDVWNNQPFEKMDNTVFVNGVLTSARIRHFPDAATALAATNGGTGEGETTTYFVDSTPNGNVGEVLQYRKLKQ